MTERQKRVFVRRGLPTRVGEIVPFLRDKIQAGTNNPLLPGAEPLLVPLRAATDVFEEAYLVAQTGAKGLREARDGKLRDVREAWDPYVSFVERLANSDLERAREVLATAHLDEKERTLAEIPPFEVEPGAMSGTVDAKCRSAGDRAGYTWAFSLDGGKTWTIAGRTMHAHYTFRGLPPARYVMFRVQITLPTGDLDWTEPLTLLVK
jgi:hypothetical protein